MTDLALAVVPVDVGEVVLGKLEGEGEEDEVTVHEIRSKVYKMTKDKEGKAQWGDMGVGVLRLKKHKETGARRMLLRNSSTGKITIVSRFACSGGMRRAGGGPHRARNCAPERLPTQC